MKLQIKIGGNTYTAEVEVMDEDASLPSYGSYAPSPVTSQTVQVPRTAEHPAGVNTTDEKQYRSPVAGLVIRTNVESGQEIQPGDVIMVLEAMKMETNVTARHAGKVKTVNVAPGDPVKLHQVLFELE